MKTAFELQYSELLGEFDRYVLEHPAFAERIPDGAEVVLQLRGQPRFNAWVRRLAVGNHEKGRRMVLVTVERLRPARSRLVSPRLKTIAAA